MDYSKIYYDIVSKSTLTEGYAEKHHIVPKCLGGSNEPENLVKLTARAHFIVHQLLVKIYPGNGKIACAAFRMSKRKRYSSRHYEWLRTKFCEAGHTEETKQKISNSHKGLKASEETKRKMSESAKSRKGIPFTEEHKAKIGKSISTIKKGKPRKPFTQETKEKMATAQKQRRLKENL